MHLLVRETHSLDAEAAVDDLGQSPADLVFLSFSDSDLGAVAAAWECMGGDRPSLRLANLRRLQHPMSVDLYLEQVIASARCVVVRLLGGLGYWRYGVEEVAASCRERGIALVLLPGDGRDDAALEALSTIAPAQRTVLGDCLGQGGPENGRRALLLAAHLGGLGADPEMPAVPLPMAGEFVIHPVSSSLGSELGKGGANRDFVCLDCPHPGPLPERNGTNTTGRAAIVFYRSHLQAGDVAPIEALAAALAARGLAVRAFYVASLKEPSGAAFLAEQMTAWRPGVVLNATAFSAPLAAAGAVVLQVVLAGSSQQGWAASARGLAGTDLAMNVVLPELDGRLLTGAISFKRDGAVVPGLEFARTVHAPCGCGIALAADRAAGWARLAGHAAPVLGCVLSDYPGGGRVGHAVGLDTFASLAAILGRLGAAIPATELVDGLCHAAALPTIDLATYQRLFDAFPESARAAVIAAWGPAESDPTIVEGAFTHRFMRVGTAVAAVQPDRGAAIDRKAGYHDPDCPPRHGFIAFYLWLRHVVGIDALLHVGAHGTLEWLPGKSVALSRGCFPALLTGGVPVIYPFIVNNPGEAAAAKRRLGAVTIGHMTPPLRPAGGHAGLEALLDEYAAADGMDRRRTALLRRDILALAESTGLLGESGASAALSEGSQPDDQLERLDAYLCDVKELQIRDGLHVFGDAPGEWDGLLAGLAGRFVPPGPAGAPSRGRADVLPTGRNLYSIDPRAVPTVAAMKLAEAAARELLRRHLQDQGDYPRRVVLNLWGSTTMRTGGEDFALAMILLGVTPLRDEGSGRVTGFEVVPLALLDRPRVDVTLRVSGLFRDAFGAQMELFDAAIRAVAARDEAADWNPLAAAADPVRVFGPAPGCYGAGVSAVLESGRWGASSDLGRTYLDASSTGYGRDGATGDFAALAAAADAFVQIQDHSETDLLEGSEAAAHTGGFAALARSLGGTPALYHADTGVPDAPRLRTAPEEIVRIVRGRAANPVWLAGMRRHGYRGAAEIARSLDGLFGYAATVPHRFDAQFELLWNATLGDPETDGFMRAENPAARDGMQARFDEARQRGLWHAKRNDFGADA